MTAIFSFRFATVISKITGCIKHCWKSILQGPNNFPIILVGKAKKQTYNRLAIADQGGQKNRNGKRIAILFSKCFLLVLTKVCYELWGN
jgi:hypothetical protein